MFSKQAKTDGKTEAPAVSDGAARRGPKVASLLAAGVAIDGSVTGEGELHLDGAVRGDIRVERLTIGETGVVEGAITADSVDVRGRVIGSITARQVRLFGAAHVDGDITHEQLSMEIGAFFQGRSLKLQRPAPMETAEVVTLPTPINLAE